MNKTIKLNGITFDLKELNKGLFTHIIKIMVDCKNHLTVGRLVELASERAGLPLTYVHKFVQTMYRKNMLSVVKLYPENRALVEVQLTKEACDAYRELKHGKVHEQEETREISDEPVNDPEFDDYHEDMTTARAEIEASTWKLDQE